MKKIIALSYNDFKNIRREPMLIFLTLSPVLISIGLRIVIPFFTEALKSYIDLKEYYPLISGFIILLIPMLMGVLTGFMILDERDDNTFMTLIVTPLTKEGYMIYRILVPTVISLIYSLCVLPTINFINISFITIVPAAVLAALEASLVALYLVVFAANKVEGLVYSKAIGIFMLAPVGGYFLKSNLKYLLGILPTYWAPMALIIGDFKSTEYWLHIIMGFIVNLCVLYLLIRRFNKRIT